MIGIATDGLQCFAKVGPGMSDERTPWQRTHTLSSADTSDQTYALAAHIEVCAFQLGLFRWNQVEGQMRKVNSVVADLRIQDLEGKGTQTGITGNST